MQVTIRKYSGQGASELVDLLEKDSSAIEKMLRSVTGFVSYTLARSGGGGFSVTICQDQTGIDESTQKAKDWVAKNGANISVGPPEVSHGTVFLHSQIDS